MAWVRFLADFDFSPAALKGRSTTAYKAGMVENVTRECVAQAIAAGKAAKAVAPRLKAEITPPPALGRTLPIEGREKEGENGEDRRR